MLSVMNYLRFLMSEEGNYLGYVVIIFASLIIFGLGLIVFEVVAHDEKWKALSVKAKGYRVVGFCAFVSIACVICYGVSISGLEDAETVKIVNSKIDSGYSVRVDQGGRYVYDMTNEKKCDIQDLEYFNITVNDDIKQVEFKIKPNRANW